MSTPVTSTADEKSSLNSILLKREAAASAVRSGQGSNPLSRPPSASSAGSFQLISGAKDLLTSTRVTGQEDTAADLKGESFSGGGGLTGEKNSNELMSILMDSKVVSTTKKSSATTPRGLLYQLYFVSPGKINEICGGQISSLKYDAFCGKSVSTCAIMSHQDKKHTMCQDSTVYLIGKSTSSKPGPSSQKMLNPGQFHLEIKPMYIIIAKELIISSNPKFLGVRSYEKACVLFNEFCEEYQSIIRKADSAFRVPDSRSQEDIIDEGEKEEYMRSKASRGKRSSSSDVVNKLIANLNEQVDDASSSSSFSRENTDDSDLSDSSRPSEIKTNKFGINPIEMDEGYIRKGMKFGLEFEKDPIKQVALLGSFLLKQEDTIMNLTKAVSQLLNINLVSSSQLEHTLDPVRNNLRAINSLTTRTQLSLDKHKKRVSDTRIIAKARKEIAQDLEVLLEDKINVLKDEFEDPDNSDLADELYAKLDLLERRITATEAGTSSGGGIFPSSSLVNPLIPDNVRTDMASIEFKIALLESRVGAQTLKFGPITLKSLVDTELFVNDNVPSFSYGCFFDLVALLDSLRDTTTTEKSFLESEYNAQKTKFVSVDEASISASFLHVAPLVFCGNSSSADSKYGSIERSLPNVKTRDHWVSLGGMEGMKRQLEEEIVSKVGSILEEIPMTLGDSKGAALAKEYLQASQACFTKFVTWTETFFQELLGNSQVSEKEAWTLILHCWMAFFSDLRQIRMACANLSPGRHEIGSEGRTRIVARYVWTMGRTIVLQNEYCSKQFRNHPSIATVINYHLFQHRVPMSMFKSMMGKLESEVKTINAWKAQMGRDFKEVKKLAGDRS